MQLILVELAISGKFTKFSIVIVIMKSNVIAIVIYYCISYAMIKLPK